MKPKLILKSLADIPANVLSLAASLPGRAVSASQQVLGPTVCVTRRNLVAFARDIYARASASFQYITPWQRGGLNE